MASSLSSRVAKLYSDSVGQIGTQIIVMDKDVVLREVRRGTNAGKLIRIVVRL